MQKQIIAIQLDKSILILETAPRPEAGWGQREDEVGKQNEV